MLGDLFMIELYFGPTESVQIEDDLIQKYGEKTLSHALSKGYLSRRELFQGPLRGKILYWLSEEGREKAKLSCPA